MILMGIISSVRKFPRQTLTLIGCGAAAVGFLTLGVVALLGLKSLLLPTLFCMGLCAGVFNVGALALMMDMTVDGATGLYMGLWGIAQAIGMGGSAVAAGALHTVFIDSSLVEATVAYWLIFSLEGGLLLGAALVLARVDVAAFQRGAVRSAGVQHRDEAGAAILDVATAGA
jgi:BCD family chlorophyll transporter-like MFS transporter